MTDDHLALQIQTACLWEVSARKIGNVHPKADFADMTHLDFALSAAAVASVFRKHLNLSFAELVYECVDATKSVTTRNTNLGIILLLASLTSGDVHHTLRSISLTDTQQVYDAIRLASPGGLGDAPEQDVREAPTVSLVEAMKLAADRDLIARQYANGFADVFNFGVPAFVAAYAKFGCIEAAVIDCQLRWMAEFPDSLIARKNGLAVAEDVRQRVVTVQKLGGLETVAGRAAGVALDQYLRSDGNKLNPGTTADLVTACLFVALRQGKVKPSDPFRWAVPDWL